MTYGNYTYNTTIEVIFVLGSEAIEWEVSIDMECTYPGDPGRLSGPPEDCYPPEGPEFEWTRVHVFVGSNTVFDTSEMKVKEVMEQIGLVIGEKTFEILEARAHEAACEGWDPLEDDYDYFGD